MGGILNEDNRRQKERIEMKYDALFQLCYLAYVDNYKHPHPPRVSKSMRYYSYMEDLKKKLAENWKQLVLLIIVVLILIAVAMFMFLRSDTNSTNTTETGVFPQAGDRGIGFPSTNEQGGISNTPATTTDEIPLLRQLWSKPVSGAGYFRSNEETLAVRFVERASGHIYDIPTDSLTATKILNITIPRIQHAFFFNNGGNLILQYLSDLHTSIETYSATLIPVLDDGENAYSLDGTFLPADITAITPSPDGKSLSFIQKNETGSTLYRSSLDAGSAVELFRSPFKSWRLEWASPSRVVLTSAPHPGAIGSTFAIATEDGALKSLVTSKNGSFTASSNDNLTYTVFSEEIDKVVRLYAYDYAKKERKNLNLSTFMDKCVWSNVSNTTLYCFVPNQLVIPGNILAWNQGGGNFADNMWKIDVSTGEAVLLYQIDKEFSKYLDAIKPVLADDDSSITFIDKNDLTPWLLLLSTSKGE